MVKFTINSKDLKAVLEKGITAINKKSAIRSLTYLTLKVINNELHVFSTDMENFLEVKTDNIWNISEGVFILDSEDVKTVSKMPGDITFIYDTDSLKTVNLSNGKKKMTIPSYLYNDNKIEFPVLQNEELAAIFTESWITQTLLDMVCFTSNDDTNKIMKCFNFNFIESRIEALDGYKIATRKLDTQNILYNSKNILLNNSLIDIVKKVFSKKSNNKVSLFDTEKYIKIVGEDFTLIQRKTEGKYFKVSQLLQCDDNFHFTSDTKEFLEIMKYDVDIIKENKKPVIFHNDNNSLYAYTWTYKYELLDEIKTKNLQMPNDLFIGFNPQFLVAALNIIDADETKIVGTNQKAPIMVYGNEYSFVILPIHLQDGIENMTNAINRKVA